MKKSKTYSELKELNTFKERFEYLQTNSSVGTDTFGYDRYLNQNFYSTQKWKQVRDEVILRDNCCDLGLEGYDIYGRVYVHHINPITKDDLLEQSSMLTDPENLICVSFETHNAIHYGNIDNLPKEPIERSKNDTCPWRKD